MSQPVSMMIGKRMILANDRLDAKYQITVLVDRKRIHARSTPYASNKRDCSCVIPLIDRDAVVAQKGGRLSIQNAKQGQGNYKIHLIYSLSFNYTYANDRHAYNHKRMCRWYFKIAYVFDWARPCEKSPGRIVKKLRHMA
jgi:hypothetical protein